MYKFSTQQRVLKILRLKPIIVTHLFLNLRDTFPAALLRVNLTFLCNICSLCLSLLAVCISQLSGILHSFEFFPLGKLGKHEKKRYNLSLFKLAAKLSLL